MSLIALRLHATMPWLSFRARSLVDAMLLTRGSIGSATGVARRIGLANRFGLSRILRREGLPSLSRLSAWIAVLCWTWTWETHHESLGRLARTDDRDPAFCYRLVRRLTNKPWRVVRELGTGWVLQNLLEECILRGTPRKKRAARLPSPLVMPQARSLIGTSARLPCWQAPAESNPRKSNTSWSSWCGTPWR